MFKHDRARTYEKNRAPRRLVLARTTIRILTEQTLVRIVGGPNTVVEPPPSGGEGCQITDAVSCVRSGRTL